MKKNENEELLTSNDAEKIKEAATQVAEKAIKFIKKHPLESVAGALLIGVVAGLFINRK